MLNMRVKVWCYHVAFTFCLNIKKRRLGRSADVVPCCPPASAGSIRCEAESSKRSVISGACSVKALASGSSPENCAQPNEVFNAAFHLQCYL